MNSSNNIAAHDQERIIAEGRARFADQGGIITEQPAEKVTQVAGEPMSVGLGESDKTIIVTREGFEGGILIDAFTGVVRNVNDYVGQEPSHWAAGLTQAALQERHIFWATRLGILYTDELREPTALDFRDLHWLQVNELPEPLVLQPEVVNEVGVVTQEEVLDYFETVEIAADLEYRMELFTSLTGLEADMINGTFGEGYQSVEVTNEVSEEQAAEHDASQEAGMQAVGNQG